MKRILPKSIELLTDKLSHLPSIGPKTAGRLTFALLQRPQSFVQDLGNAVLALKQNLHSCPRCFLITDEPDLCVICQDSSRDQSVLCTVEGALDVVAIESSGVFQGTYHILGGVISPLEGIGPDQLHIKELVARVKKEKPSEVIVATNPSLEGEATALYITDMLQKSGAKVTRIARGLPIGGSLEYADEVTLARSLEGRQSVTSAKE